MLENSEVTTTSLKDESSFKCKLEFFEGPLDLLLYLIKKNELDIYDIALETVISQYMEYLELMKSLDIDLASEFIVTAATLLHIKTKWLLPSDKQDGDEEEEEDPRLDLLKQLLEYKQFKEAAHFLDDLQEKESLTFEKGYVEKIDKSNEKKILNMDVFDLSKAFKEVIKQKNFSNQEKIYAEHFTIEQKISDLRRKLEEEKTLFFSRLFEESQSKEEVICIFLGILELIKLSEISIYQENPIFGEIIIKKIDNTTPD